jgi:glycosyltransferase involved in cell wall biosynthesis
VILSIGNYRPTKRFEEAVAVLGKVRREVLDAELILLGRAQDASYLIHLRRTVSKSGLDRAVRFYVGASDAEKFELLSRAKVLSIHSPIEGFGWTILEAGLCGVPTVGNTGVSADALREGVNGRRIAFGDTEGYAAAIVRLLRDGTYWESFSRGARSVALEFSSGAVSPQVRELLARCRASRPVSPAEVCP